MRYYTISALVILVFTMLATPIAAQSITDLAYDEDILVRLTEQQPDVAYSLVTDAPLTLDAAVRYLGGTFGMTLEVFDASGQPVATARIAETGTLTVAVPPGDNLLLLTADAGQSGRAVVRFSASADMDASMGDDMVLGPIPGEWRVTYGESTTSCPKDMDLANAWLPADGSVHVLSFSQPPLPLEFHEVVAPEEVADDPGFFETEAFEEASSAIVIPGIQTAPYTYVYTVLSPTQISLAYTETLALSDCVLTATLILDSIPDGGEDAPTLMETASVAAWTVVGETGMPSFNDNSSICAGNAQSGQTWYFDAPQDFVTQVVNGYGRTLSFQLSHDTTTSPYDDMDVILVVGNGILLANTLPTNPGTDFTTYTFALDETGGWVEDMGIFDASDPELITQMLRDVTRVQIRGNYSSEASTGCLRDPKVID